MRRPKKGAKQSYRLIKTDMTPNELDALLRSQYGHGLYSFTFCLAEAVYHMPFFGWENMWMLRSVRCQGHELYYTEINRIADIRARAMKLLKPLKVHFRKLPDWHTKRIPGPDPKIKKLAENIDVYKDTPFEDETILRAYGLDRLIRTLEEERRYLDSCYKSIFQKRPGKEVQATVILMALWAMVMRKARVADVRNVKALLDWYAHMLKGTSYEGNLDYWPEGSSIYRFSKKNERLLAEARALYFPPKQRQPGGPDNLQFDFSQTPLTVKSIHLTCERAVFPQLVFRQGLHLKQEFIRDPNNGRAIPVWPTQTRKAEESDRRRQS